jgi:putative transposase
MQRRIRHLFDKLYKKVTKWTCGNMLAWSHYKFKTRLINKAREYANCRVIICSEEYTSQTCSECEFLHCKIGGAKEFKCSQCNQKLDRDFNAARNILKHDTGF